MQLTFDSILNPPKVLLIDADSTIPNLALMKLSRHYKDLGYAVDLKRANLPYYPNKKKNLVSFDTSDYESSFCSVVFKGNAEFIKGEGIEFGGSGFDIYKKLSDEIENLEPDYSIYPESEVAYGFISRGCNRVCYFCSVWVKEGKTHIVNTVKKIIGGKKYVKFLDNNFLQNKNHKEILREIIEYCKKGVKVQFNQGLDIRLIDEENSKLLSELNYIGEYIFAFDDIKYKNIIKKKLELMKWMKPFKFKFFVYVNPDMGMSETVDRIETLKEWECLPYIMRDISCWGSENEKFYTDLAAWCNQPSIFKSMNFEQFLNKRHTSKNRDERIEGSLELYNSSCISHK